MKLTRILSAGALALATLILPIAPAFADVATSVDVAPAITSLLNEYLNPLVQLLAMAAVGWLAWLANTRLHISISEANRKMAIDWCAREAAAILAKVVNVKEFNIDVKNPLIAAAANAALPHIGDALKGIGITGAAVSDFAAKQIVSRLGDLTKDTPDAPTPAGAIPGTHVTVDGATVPMTPLAAAA
jgi:hypothetical protein